LTITEKIWDENMSKEVYLNDEEFEINLKVHSPRNFKFIFDYEHYHFDFDQFLNVMYENNFKEFEANIDTLMKQTNSLSEVNEYHNWSKNCKDGTLKLTFEDQTCIKIKKIHR